jgi:LysM repeat protein
MDSRAAANGTRDPANPGSAAPAAEPPLTPPLSDGACPFLVAAGGAWRMSVPDREHRCAAFTPATSLAPSKQARLCLTPGHSGCATYLASISARQSRVGTGVQQARAGRWSIARTTPVIEEVGGLRATLGAFVADRRTWPAIPAVLLATLALALGLSGTWGDGPTAAVASPTHTAPTISPTPVATPSLPPSEAPTGAPSEAPTPAPTLAPSPTPKAYLTYRVQSGDTLSRIASHFHTTVSAIAQLNNITPTTILRIGQVLKIPNS